MQQVLTRARCFCPPRLCGQQNMSTHHQAYARRETEEVCITTH